MELAAPNAAGPSHLARAPRRSAELGLTTDFLRDQIGRLGNTPYELATLEADIEGRPFVPSSLLNRMRRDAVEGLQELQGRAAKARVGDPQANSRRCSRAPTTPGHMPPQLHLLVRNPEQLEAAIALEPASITLDYLDLYGLKPSVDRLLGSGIAARVASPRVLKPGEGRIAEFLAACNADFWSAPPAFFTRFGRSPHPPLFGDFSLNAANSISTATLLGMGLDRITPTHDLNAAQIADLARTTDASASRRSHISICPCSTPSTAYSADFCPREPLTKTAAARAKNIASKSETTAGARTRRRGCRLPQHGIRRRGPARRRASPGLDGSRHSATSASSSSMNPPTKSRV